MSTIEQIKHTIEGLSMSDRGRLEQWMHGWSNDEWDTQITRDANDGKLDALLSEVGDELGADKLRDLPRVEGNPLYLSSH